MSWYVTWYEDPVVYDDYVMLSSRGGYNDGGSGDDHSTATATGKCDIPQSSCKAGSSLTVNVTGNLSNIVMGKNKFTGYNSSLWKVDIYDVAALNNDGMGFYPFAPNIKGKQDTGKYAGQSDVRLQTEGTETTLVTITLPETGTDGQQIMIAFSNCASNCYYWKVVDGQYTYYAQYYAWIYTYNASGSSDDDATTIGDDTDDEDDIVVGQVKNVKLTNKKVKRIYISYSAVSGAKSYEIQYATNKKLSGAKKLTTTATKGYFKNAKGKKATFKKGKTYYVRVRAYAKDSSGDKVYGKWSAIKSVKIKK